jgi:hypothetical protein
MSKGWDDQRLSRIANALERIADATERVADALDWAGGEKPADEPPADRWTERDKQLTVVRAVDRWTERDKQLTAVRAVFRKHDRLAGIAAERLLYHAAGWFNDQEWEWFINARPDQWNAQMLAEDVRQLGKIGASRIEAVAKEIDWTQYGYPPAVRRGANRE